jgi:hypothetical protein
MPSHSPASVPKSGAMPYVFCLDAVRDPLPTDYDVLSCSLFLLHLEQAQAVDLLRRMAAAAWRCVLVHDLRRGLAGFWLAYVGARVLSRCDVLHIDGPRSVRAAFTVAEAAELARRAGLEGTAVTPRWPFRFLLSWRTSGV